MNILGSIFAYVRSLRYGTPVVLPVLSQAPVQRLAPVVKKLPPMTWRSTGGPNYRADEKPEWNISRGYGAGRKVYALSGHNGRECLLFGTLVRAKRYAETIREV